MLIQFIEYTKSFLDKSWVWLNDPEIKALTSTPDFSKEEQLKWFHSLSYRKDYLIWGVLIDQKPIGVFGLKNITNKTAEYWGYIGEKEYWGIGVGSIIIEEAQRIAISMGIDSLYLNVVKENTRAQKLYQKKGFVICDRSNKWLLMKLELK